MNFSGSDLELQRRLRVELTTRIDGLTDAMIARQAENFADYSRMCGEIRGLRDALEVMDDIAKVLMGS